VQFHALSRTDLETTRGRPTTGRTSLKRTGDIPESFERSARASASARRFRSGGAGSMQRNFSCAETLFSFLLSLSLALLLKQGLLRKPELSFANYDDCLLLS
jgi:hypothetical protein